MWEGARLPSGGHGRDVHAPPGDGTTRRGEPPWKFIAEFLGGIFPRYLITGRDLL